MPASLTEANICNMALSELGAGQITALSDTSKEGVKCALYYPIARDFLLERFDWNFATVRIKDQARLSTDPIYGFANAYSVPPDSMRVLAIATNDQEIVANRDGGYAWKKEFMTGIGQVILTDFGPPINIRYIKAITDTQQFTATFAIALSKYLASVLAIPLTRDRNRKIDAQNEFQAFIREAQQTDQFEGSGIVWVADDLEIVRLTSGNE